MLQAASDKHPLTLLPTPVAGTKPKQGNCESEKKYNHLKQWIDAGPTKNQN